MKNSIAYNQALRWKKNCYNKSDLEKNSQRLLTTLTNRGSGKTKTMSHINKAVFIPRNEILNKNPTENDEKTPLIATFNRTLPDLRHIVNKNWDVLQREPKLKEMSKNPPVAVFQRNKNLRDFIGGNKPYSNKKLMHARTCDKGKCHPCLTRTIYLWCKQIISTLYFQSAITRKTFDSRHFVTCKSSWVIYLKKGCLCTNSQYIGKSEYSMNLRISWRVEGG